MGTNPLLANAHDLDRWADTRESQGAFPELMRRLLAQTPGITNINIRAHEGIAAHGWDGTATSDGSSFLPKGELRFEFGTNKDPQAKANRDYNNRAEKVTGKSDEIFVFATPRIWRGTATWVEERRQKGVFASVEAFDAERLQGWLQSTPAVHYWLSEKLGKPIADAQTLESWWEIQQRNHGRRVPSELHVLGRDKEVLQLKSLGFPKNPSLLVCARSQTDVLAFCYEALRNIKDKPLEHALVINNVAAWNNLIRCDTPLILIPLFENPNIGEALSREHCVIEPGSKRAVRAVGEEVIELADMPAYEGRRLLVRAGWKEDEAAAFVGRMQRSGSGLPSSGGRIGVQRVPDWAQSELAAEILAPLILIGAWKDGDPNDEKIVGKYLKKDMDDVRSYLVQQARMDDEKCPVICWGQVWRFVDRQEAAVYLLPLLGEKQLKNWVQFVENVVVCRLAKSVVSEELLHSMLQGLAIIASVESELLNGDSHVSRYIDKIVDSILEGVAKGDSVDVLSSVAFYLPAFAEAAPDTFLRQAKTIIQKINGIRNAHTSTGSSLRYAEFWSEQLLRSLKLLCWFKEYYFPAVQLLAMCVELNLHKTALCYLLEVVSFGWANGVVSAEAKLELVDSLFEDYLNVAGLLLRDIVVIDGSYFYSLQDSSRWCRLKIDGDLNSQVSCEKYPSVPEVLMANPFVFDYSSGSELSEPCFRTCERWRLVLSRQKMYDYCDDLIKRVFEKRVLLPHLWPSLADAFYCGSQSVKLAIIKAVRRLLAENQTVPCVFWQSVRAVVEWCRSDVKFRKRWPDAQLNLLLDIEHQVRPSNLVYSNTWLFDVCDNPLLEALSFGCDHPLDCLTRMRGRIVKKLYDSGSRRLQELVSNVSRPELVGEALADSSDNCVELINIWLRDESSALNSAAIGFIGKITVDQYPDFLESLSGKEVIPPCSLSLLLRMVPFSESLLSELEKCSSEDRRELLSGIDVFALQLNCVEAQFALIRLFCETELYSQAAMLLSQIQLSAEQAHFECVKRVLINLAHTNPSPDNFDTASAVVALLCWLEQNCPDVKLVAELEYLLFDYVEGGGPTRALYELISEDSSLFINLVLNGYSSSVIDSRQSCWTFSRERSRHVVSRWTHFPWVDDKWCNFEPWLNDVLSALTNHGFGTLLDDLLAPVFAVANPETYGVWPLCGVRRIIEQLDRQSLSHKIAYCRFGIERGDEDVAFDDLDRLRELAIRYKEASDKWIVTSPRCSYMLSVLSRLLSDLVADYNGLEHFDLYDI